jgi:hypothetical protein
MQLIFVTLGLSERESHPFSSLLLVLVLVIHRHDRHLHPCLLSVQENRERWTACLMVLPTSPGAMACTWRVSCFPDAPAGLEASSIRHGPWIGTTVGLLTVVPTVAGSLRALTP